MYDHMWPHQDDPQNLSKYSLEVLVIDVDLDLDLYVEIDIYLYLRAYIGLYLGVICIFPVGVWSKFTTIEDIKITGIKPWISIRLMLNYNRS